ALRRGDRGRTDSRSVDQPRAPPVATHTGGVHRPTAAVKPGRLDMRARRRSDRRPEFGGYPLFRFIRAALAVCAAASVAACATTAAKPEAKTPAPAPVAAAPLPKGLDPAAVKDPFPSTYRPLPGRPTAIVGATVLTGTGAQVDNGTVLIRDGKIEAVGAG